MMTRSDGRRSGDDVMEWMSDDEYVDEEYRLDVVIFTWAGKVLLLVLCEFFACVLCV